MGFMFLIYQKIMEFSIKKKTFFQRLFFLKKKKIILSFCEKMEVLLLQAVANDQEEPKFCMSVKLLMFIIWFFFQLQSEC